MPQVSPTAALPTRAVSAANDLSGIYVGCMHSAHTVESDGKLQYPDEFYPTFRRYWDWIATTDHDYAIDPAKWQDIVRSADAYNDEGFVSLVGYEWTSPNWGHMSVIFKGEPPLQADGLASATDPAYDTPRKLYDFLRLGNGLATFAHPALAGCSIDFGREQDYRDDSVAPLVGMFGYGDTTHWNGTWHYVNGAEVPVLVNGATESRGWIKNALDRGYRLGFVGELDMHEKKLDPMSYRYTGVVTGRLTREDIFEALRTRHTYAVRSPSGVGKRILLRADAGNHLMGDIFNADSNILKVILRGKTDPRAFHAGKRLREWGDSGESARLRTELVGEFQREPAGW